MNGYSDKKNFIFIIHMLFVVAFFISIPVAYGVTSSNYVEYMGYKTDQKRMFSVLQQAVKLHTIAVGSLNMSSGTSIAKDLSKHIIAKEVNGDTITDQLDAQYKFSCDNTGCMVYIDVNGKNKGPNKITKSMNDMQDIVVCKIVKKQNGEYTILVPEWHDELKAIRR